MLGLGLKVSVRAVNKKSETRNQHDTDAFLSHHVQLFFPQTAGADSLVAIAWAIADDVLPFHYLIFSTDKTNQSAR